MLSQISLYAVAVWCVVGVLCGWLETLRSHGHLYANILIGVAGAAAAGIIFKWVGGELGLPWQAPIYSAFIGAAIAIVLLSPILRYMPTSASK